MLVVMTDEGEVTLPAEVRKELGLQGATSLQAEVVDGALVLRPAVFNAEDDWLYTPDQLARIEQALRDVREGRVHRMSENDLNRLVGDPVE